MLIKSKKAEVLITFLVFFLLIFLLSACSSSGPVSNSGSTFSPKDPSAGEPKTETAFLLDTIVTVTYYTERDADAVQSALALCDKYEHVFSRTDPDSELFKLNAAGGGTVSDDLRTVLETALRFCERSSGSFDITMGGVSSLYGFSSEAPRLPAPEEITDALRHVDYRRIRLDGNTMTMDDPETVIDLGAIAKGYIADRMKDDLLACGVEHAIINLGGNILCVGAKPDGSDYQIGIQHPEKSGSHVIATVPINDLSVVTSGIYQRFFEQDGITWHHILNSETGYPVDNGLVSVSVIGKESMLCDVLSTACFTLGPEDGMALIDSTDDYYAIFITGDNILHCSAGLKEILNLK